MRTRKKLAVGILLLGIGVSLFLFFRGTKGNSSALAVFDDSTKDDSRFADIGSTIDPTDITNPKLNITEEVAKEYGKRILQMNEAGQGTTTPIVVPGQDELTSIIGDQVSREIPSPTYEDKDIKIIKETTKENIITYFQLVSAANKKNITPIRGSYLSALSTFVTDKNSDLIQKHMDAISQEVTDLLAIPVPENLKAFHLEFINLWQRRLTLATVIYESSDDPLKTVIALEEVSKLTDREQILADTINNFLKK